MPIAMSYAYQLQREKETIQAFIDNHPGFQSAMPDYLDTLFLLSYFAKQKEPTAENDAFPYFVFERYVRLPYTLRSIWVLVATGFYAEASVLVRHLLESFVQTRYFATRREELLLHLTSPTQKGRTQFKVMFDALSPAYYDIHYRLLSNIAHAGVAWSVFSGMKKDPNGSGKMLTPIGSEYEADACSYILNHTLMLISGYLSHVPAWFSHYSELVDANTEKLRQKNLAMLTEWRKGHRAKFEYSHSWVDATDQLLGHAEPSKG